MNLAVSIVPRGWRWIDSKEGSVLEWLDDWEKEDSLLEETEKVTNETRTLDLI